MAASELAVADVKRVPRERLRWAVIALCVLVILLLAAQVLTHGPMLELDQAVSTYFSGQREPATTRAMLWVAALHRTAVVLSASVVIAAAFALRGHWRSVRALAVVPTAMILNVALKTAIQRARPSWPDPLVQLATYSFPSGHAVASSAFYGMLCALVFAHTRSPLARGAALAIAVGMVALVCFSRVYLGAHYPSDVIAGSAEGLACVLLFLRLLRR